MNSGTAFGCAINTAGTATLTISLQNNGAAFNTTGASMIVVATDSWQGAPTATVSDNKGNGYAAITNQIPGPAGIIDHQVWYSVVSTGVGAGHTWTIDGALQSLCVIAVSGTSSYLPFVTYTLATGTTTSLSSPGAQNINHTNAFVISTAANWNSNFATGPTGYSAVIKKDFDGTNTGTAMAWKFDTTYTQTEQPTWTFAAGAQDNALTNVIFRAANSVNRIGHGPCTTTAVSASLTDVTSAVNAAQPGDVVCIPASSGGVATPWNSQLTYGGVELRGAGTLPTVGSPRLTKIYMGTTISGGLALVAGNESLQYPSMIDGIDWSIDNNSDPDQQTFSMLVFAIPNGTGWPFILHHNDYDITRVCGFGPGGPVLNNFATSHGVVYRNRAIGTPPSDGVGTGCTPGVHGNTNLQFIQVNGTTPWASADSQGSLDNAGLANVYLDQNQITGFFATTDCSDNCRMAIRGNTIDSGGIRSHGFDSDPNGTRTMELIGNTFLCNAVLQAGGFYVHRGGNHYIFNNSYPAPNNATCNVDGGGYNDNAFFLYRFYLCTSSTTSGWPGSYPGTYPQPHQYGFGYNPANLQNAGLGQSGTNYQQTPEPMYEANNTYNPGVGHWDLDFGPSHECRAQSVSTQSTTMAATTSLSVTGAFPAYINTGMTAVVTFADRIGGVAPTISNTCSDGGTGQAQTWTARSGGTNGAIRLSIWTAVFNRTCNPVITIAHNNSNAARALAFTGIRGLVAGNPVDQNPAVVTYSGVSSYNAPAATPSVSTGEIALEYVAADDQLAFGLGPLLNGMQCPNGSACAPTLDSANEIGANTCGPPTCPQTPYATAENGTAASVNNIVLATVYRNAADATPISGGNAMNITDTRGNANAVAGIITFKVGTNTSGGSTSCSGVSTVYAPGVSTPSCLDLLITDMVQTKRDFFSEVFDGSSSHGTRASRPACTVVGQGYWATDQGTWNTSGTGQNGVLDVCTVVGNPGTWTNAFYVPANLPNVWEDVIGGSASQFVSVQPSSIVSGGTFSPTVVDTLTGTTGADSIVVSGSAGLTLTGTTTRTSTGGTPNTATFTSLGATAVPGTGFTLTFHNNTEAMTDVVSNTFQVTGTMSFTTQPVNVATGATMTSFAVTTSNTSAVTVTLTPNACGAGFTNLTQTTSGGVATFSTVVASGSGTACNFTASAPNYASVVSANFNVTGVTPVLTFAAQPSNIVSGGTFSPTIVANLSAAAVDSIVLSVNSGSGTLTGTTTVSTSGGSPNQATFTGVGITGTPASGLTLKLHDATNGAVADVISNPFTITGTMTFTTQPVTTVAGNTMASFAVTTSNTSAVTVTLSPNNCGAGFTNLTATTSGGVATFSTVGTSGAGVNCNFVASAPNYANVTSANFNITQPPPVLVFSTQPTNTVSGQNFSPVVVTGINNTSTDSVTLSINTGTGSLTGTTTASFPGTTPNNITFTGLGITGTPASGFSLKLHDNTNGTVSDVISNQFAVTGTMSFTTQPVTTTTGNTMASFAVTTSNTAAVTVTLQPNNCGAGFTNLSATTSAGVATFSTVATSGTGNNCNFVASAPNYGNVTSSNFNVVPINFQQAWTSQPTTTQSGSLFFPTPAITVTPPVNDTFTFTLQGCASAGLSGVTTVTAIQSTGVASLFNVGVTGKGTGCSIKSHDTTNTSVTDATSATFNINNVNVFSVQPGNTQTGNLFSPTITVTQRASSTDSLTMSVTSGSCTLTGTLTATVSGTTASWPGLQANALGLGCVIKIHDNTDANVSDIFSVPFNITVHIYPPIVPGESGRAKTNRRPTR